MRCSDRTVSANAFETTHCFREACPPAMSRFEYFLVRNVLRVMKVFYFMVICFRNFFWDDS